MWPWEHVAFAYVVYSLSTRAISQRPPSNRSVYPLAFGALFPDLVDKPLAWTLGVFPSGYAVGHSLFALPVFATVALVAFRTLHWTRGSVAYSLGHGTHLLGDVVYPSLVGGPLATSAVLWPLVRIPATPPRRGFVETVTDYFTTWVGTFGSPETLPLLAFEVSLAALVVALWVLDGTPGIRPRRAVED